MKQIGLSWLVLLLALQGVANQPVNHRVDAGQVRVASYNLRMDTERDGIHAWAFRAQAVIALLRFHDLEIIGTQEGFLHQVEALTRSGVYEAFGAGRDDGKQAGEHAAILYKTDRFQLLDGGNFWLSETPDVPSLGWDATCCHRVTTWVQLKELNTGNVLFVFNTHFDHQGVEARKESSKLLLQKIQQIAGNQPVICMGDFNSTPETTQIQELAAVLQDAYEVSVEPPYGPIGTFNGFKWEAEMNNRIDYVFLSSHFTVLRYATLSDSKDQKFPSDHLPVVADVTWVR